jgi:large subunit ribosomal protein L6
MSRIGKQPIEVPGGVELKLDGQHLTVKGPKGQLELHVHPDMKLDIEGGVASVSRPSDQPNHRALHGLTRSLIANMVEGVTDGFAKTLEIQGVGYRAEKSGRGITLHLGFSHPVQYEGPAGVEIEVPNQTTVVVSGADKQAVGQAAAEIRGFRPPEPYKGKGVRYKDEYVRRKAGKTAASG